jgi:hypothetical protein
VPEAKTTRLKEKIAKLREEIERLNALNARMMASEDKQISLSDPDARSMATSGKGSGIVGYIVQSAADTTHHLIVAHEVTNVGTDRSQLSNMAEQARAEIGAETLDVVADRGYYDGQEILACETIGIMVTLPKPMTSSGKAAGRFGKQDFIYVAADDIYRCPAGAALGDGRRGSFRHLVVRKVRGRLRCGTRFCCTVVRRGAPVRRGRRWCVFRPGVPGEASARSATFAGAVPAAAHVAIS